MSAPDDKLPGEVWRDIDKRFGRPIAVTIDDEGHATPWEYAPDRAWGVMGWQRVAYADSLGFGAAIFAAYAAHLRARAERAEAALAKIEEAKAHRRAKPRKCRACAHIARSGEGGEAPHTCERAKCGTCRECISLATVDDDLPPGSYVHDTGDKSFDCDLDGNHGDVLAADTETPDEFERRIVSAKP